MFTLLLLVSSPLLSMGNNGMTHKNKNLFRAHWNTIDWANILKPELSCCALHTNSEEGCLAEPGSTCVWMDIENEPFDKKIFDNFGSQCVGQAFYTCKTAPVKDLAACCGDCCPCPPESAEPAPGPPPPPGTDPESNPQCGPAPAPPANTPSPGSPAPNTPAPGSPAPAPQPGPGPTSPELPYNIESVESKINSAAIDGCTSNSDNCWLASDRAKNPNFDRGQNANYQPNTISYTGSYYKTSTSSCCYKYNSVKNDIKACNGKSSGQSHITMDIDCTSSFQVTQGIGNSGYGPDGSTCYEGLKIEEECEGNCNYEVCIRWDSLGANECPTTKGWLMDKAGDAFSFVAQEIPSCNMGPQRIKESMSYIQMMGIESAFGVSYQMIAISVFCMVIFGLLVYFGCYSDKDGKYKAINDGPDDFKKYSTF